LGQRIFPEAITITEDPHRPRGQRSKPFDAEGIANHRRAIIDKGVLTTWLLDLRSARQLGLKTTGHAARGTASPPSPSATNIWIEPGAVRPEALIADIKNGFYVTELMGMGVNGLTGDYSRGAAGFWIENGREAPFGSQHPDHHEKNTRSASLKCARNVLSTRRGRISPEMGCRGRCNPRSPPGRAVHAAIKQAVALLAGHGGILRTKTGEDQISIRTRA